MSFQHQLHHCIQSRSRKPGNRIRCHGVPAQTAHWNDILTYGVWVDLLRSHRMLGIPRAYYDPQIRV